MRRTPPTIAFCAVDCARCKQFMQKDLSLVHMTWHAIATAACWFAEQGTRQSQPETGVHCGTKNHTRGAIQSFKSWKWIPAQVDGAIFTAPGLCCSQLHNLKTRNCCSTRNCSAFWNCICLCAFLCPHQKHSLQEQEIIFRTQAQSPLGRGGRSPLLRKYSCLNRK